MFTQQEAQALQPKAAAADALFTQLKAMIDGGAAGQPVSPAQLAQLAAKTAQAVLDLVVQAEFLAGT